MTGQMTLEDIWSGKTSQAPLAATPAATSKRSSQKSLGSQNRMPLMCLCLKRESGQKQDASTMNWQTGAWPGGLTIVNGGVSLRGEKGSVCWLTSPGLQRQRLCLTLNIGEHPRTANPSKLSQILEQAPDSRYNLSAKACQGILNRAKRRGKELPEALRLALERQASALTDGMSRASTSNRPMESQKPCTQENADMQAENHTLCQMQSASKNEQENRGGGKGILIQNEHTGALSTLNNQSVFCLQGNGIDRADTAGCNGKGWKEDVSYTLNTIDRPAVVALNDQGGSVMNVSTEATGALRAQEHGHQPVIFHDRDDIHEEHHDEPIMIEMTSTKNTIIEDGISTTLTARMGTGGNQVNAICMDVGFFQTEEEKAGALLARQYKDPPITYQDKTGALMASGYQKNGTQEAANDMYVTDNLARRLTPKECERLQAFPDDWTNIGEWTDSKGKKHKDADSPRYKALGNSIALPFWFWLLRRISAQYERPATLGSLFDGIGGFPLCWEKCNGRGTAIWASEIEEFPIAVTKLRFPEEE